MSALDELKEIDLEIITPLQAAVVYLSGKHEGDAAMAAAELADYELRLDLLAKGATWEHNENGRLNDELAQLVAERDALAARVGELEGLLKPFAEKFIEQWEKGVTDATLPAMQWNVYESDLRNAANALAQTAALVSGEGADNG